MGRRCCALVTMHLPAFWWSKKMVRAAMFKEKNLGVPALWRGLKDGLRGRFGAMSNNRYLLVAPQHAWVDRFAHILFVRN